MPGSDAWSEYGAAGTAMHTPSPRVLHAAANALPDAVPRATRLRAWRRPSGRANCPRNAVPHPSSLRIASWRSTSGRLPSSCSGAAGGAGDAGAAGDAGDAGAAGGGGDAGAAAWGSHAALAAGTVRGIEHDRRSAAARQRRAARATGRGGAAVRAAGSVPARPLRPGRAANVHRLLPPPRPTTGLRGGCEH